MQLLPESLELAPLAVHLWWGSLLVSPSELESLSAILAEDELARAARFRFDEHRSRFIVARSLLRQLLARYLHLSPQEVQFEYDSYGKPRLSGGHPLQFNLSHSQDLVLYGFTYHASIGVDLEYLRGVKDVLTLAERFFCPSEYEFLRRLDPEEQIKFFFRAWTAKEAYLKAVGAGLSGGLERVELDLSLQQPLKLRALEGDTAKAAQWSLVSLELDADFASAIAIQRLDYHCRVFPLPHSCPNQSLLPTDSIFPTPHTPHPTPHTQPPF